MAEIEYPRGVVLLDQKLPSAPPSENPEIKAEKYQEPAPEYEKKYVYAKKPDELPPAPRELPHAAFENRTKPPGFASRIANWFSPPRPPLEQDILEKVTIEELQDKFGGSDKNVYYACKAIGIKAALLLQQYNLAALSKAFTFDNLIELGLERSHFASDNPKKIDISSFFTCFRVEPYEFAHKLMLQASDFLGSGMTPPQLSKLGLNFAQWQELGLTIADMLKFDDRQALQVFRFKRVSEIAALIGPDPRASGAQLEPLLASKGWKLNTLKTLGVDIAFQRK